MLRCIGCIGTPLKPVVPDSAELSCLGDNPALVAAHKPQSQPAGLWVCVRASSLASMLAMGGVMVR